MLEKQKNKEIIVQLVSCAACTEFPYQRIGYYRHTNSYMLLI